MMLQTSHQPWSQGGSASPVESSPGRSAPSALPRLSSRWGRSPVAELSPWHAPVFPPARWAGPAFCGPDWELRCLESRKKPQRPEASGETPGPSCRGQTPQSSGLETDRPASRWRPLHSTAERRWGGHSKRIILPHQLHLDLTLAKNIKASVDRAQQSKWSPSLFPTSSAKSLEHGHCKCKKTKT